MIENYRREKFDGKKFNIDGKYLQREDWSFFLISICNPIAGAADLCVSLGLVAYLEQLDNPLIDDWHYDERDNIITI